MRETYRNQEARFEGIAAWVAERLLSPSGTYRAHGVTRATGDRGFDFVGRLDLGEGFGAIKLVVLGQAKCEAIESATSGRDIARTVARLRRGWIGVYVTTGYFSRATQAEVIQDRYPLLLVNGLQRLLMFHDTILATLSITPILTRTFRYPYAEGSDGALRKFSLIYFW